MFDALLTEEVVLLPKYMKCVSCFFVFVKIFIIFAFVKCFFGAGCNSLPAVKARDSLSRD